MMQTLFLPSPDNKITAVFVYGIRSPYNNRISNSIMGYDYLFQEYLVKRKKDGVMEWKSYIELMVSKT